VVQDECTHFWILALQSAWKKAGKSCTCHCFAEFLGNPFQIPNGDFPFALDIEQAEYFGDIFPAIFVRLQPSN
jgi:hypothetical protein